ncbi:MAG: hypothetical protein PHQ00_07265, partial [Phycisphaerae bacterium]|nr:hypothetical protein [Phycisphaerae bacterium]
VETDMLGVFGQLVGIEVNHEIIELIPGVWTCKIDFFKAMRDYISTYIPAGRIVDLVLRNNIIRSFLSATPSAKELVLMSRVMQLLTTKMPSAKKPPDIVIIDMPASGHAVLMLKTPSTATNLIRRGPVHNRAVEIDAFFSQEGNSGIIIVTLPEELAIREAIETWDAINKVVKYPVVGIVMNFASGNGTPAAPDEEKLFEVAAASSGYVREMMKARERESFARKQCEEYKNLLSQVINQPLVLIEEIIDGGDAGGIEIARKIAKRL